jgi:hypothetical protein
MRIALIAPPFLSVPPKNYGGTELFLAHLAEGLARLGIDVVVYANGESKVRAELRWLYPDCERGAMPPFGPLYRQTVYADEALAYDDEIVFNAGTHGDAIRMRYEDFAAIARPIVGRFARHP